MRLIDIITGGSVPLQMRLSSASPIPLPVSLDTIEEATFRGYSRCPLRPTQQVNTPANFGLLQARGDFVNHEAADAGVRAFAAYVVALTTPETLVGYVQLADTDLDRLPPVSFSIEVIVQVYQARE